MVKLFYLLVKSLFSRKARNKIRMMGLEKKLREIGNDIQIYSPEATIEALVNGNDSFCRFGDGEFSLCFGRSIPFQRADKKLQIRLREVLKSQRGNVMIGVPWIYFYPGMLTVSPFVQSFLAGYLNSLWFFKACSLLPLKHSFYDAGCTQLFQVAQEYDFEKYFQSVRGIWSGKDITIICGEKVFREIKENIFDCAKTLEYQYAPASDAFAEYDTILNNAVKIARQRTIVIILGPTATILAYDLAKRGYRAIDMGHIAKDYDWFKRGVVQTKETINKFFYDEK